MSAPLPMATISHKDIPDGERHEPKGVSTATAGQVYVASGSGTGSWQSLISKFTANLTPTAVSGHSSAEQAYVVSGVSTSQTLLNVIPPANTDGAAIGSARITGANEVTVVWANVTTTSKTPPAGVYTFVVAL